MRLVFVFAGPDTASRRILAVPVVARAVREAALSGVSACTICVPAPWQPNTLDRCEMQRLAPDMRITVVPTIPDDATLIAIGEALIATPVLAAALAGDPIDSPMLFPTAVAATSARPSPMAAGRMLDRRARDILAATGKPGDGIVSRWINRPVSRAITRIVLALGPVRPLQATLGTAAISLVMAVMLLVRPGYEGQLWGALLFQCASILDGVDGEIARATFRSSTLGGTIDSLVDALTNLTFFSCLMINLHLQGDQHAAMIGLAGLAGLILGMTLLAVAAVSNHGPVTFNVVKERFALRRSRLKQWLTWLTMRDFYAFAAAVFIVSGLAVPGVIAFAIVVAGWLCVVLATLLGRR